MTEDKDQLAVLGCVAVIALIPVSYVVNGYALATLWTWFMVPTFHFIALSKVQALGLSIIVSFLTHQETGTSGKADSPWALITKVFMRPAIALCSGWIIRMWM